MTELYQSQFQIGSHLPENVLKSTGSMYLVTLPVRNKQPLLGTIQGEETCLSIAGIISQQIWQELPLQFNHIKLGTFVVRPQYIQGIISISGNHVTNPDEAIQVILRAFQAASGWEIKKQSQIPFRWQSRYTLKQVTSLPELKEVERHINLQRKTAPKAASTLVA